ncbi:MAG: hypothetical protein C5B50_19525 [Verrucomicrobia bacterium]|nr:MAG: hypothetical protein C5B50_19525 [Verrucomicrobiota bacterium]
MLREADKWAAWQMEWQEKHDVPNRLPDPDPWQYLLDAVLPEFYKSVFRAAQSQIYALRRIGRMRMEFATLNADPHEKAQTAKAKGDKKGYARLITTFADRVVNYAPVQADVRASAPNAEIVHQMELALKRRRAQLVHRGQGQLARTAQHWPSWAEFASRNKLPVALASFWVSFPATLVLRKPSNGKRGLLLQPGTPGLMFFRNEAVTEFLQFALGQSNLTPAAVKKVRQRLKLKPASDKRHFVWNVSTERRSNGDWDMKLLSRRRI